jgi:tRNA dimethylallyltransferase
LTNKTLIIIAGPTASGKTDLAIKLAQQLHTEIISADSRLVYKDFNIGTAKPDKKEMQGIPHHLIDIVDPTDHYSAALYKTDANTLIDQLHTHKKIPIIAGGTGFYIRSAVDGLNIPEVQPDENYRTKLKNDATLFGNETLHQKLRDIDPLTAQKLHPNDLFRIIRALEVYKQTGKPISELQTKNPPRFNIFYAALNTENRDILYDRINRRVINMIEAGLIEEVKFLINKYGKTLSLLKTLGYKEVVEFLEEKYSTTEMIENIQKNTRRFARRQLIWFRADQRINWYTIDTQSHEDIITDILRKLEQYDR